MSIRNKLIFFLILPLALFVFAFIFISNGFVKKLLLENFEAGHNELINTHTQYFNQVLKNSAHLADNSASFIKDNANLDEMKLLEERYKPFAKWQGCWASEKCATSIYSDFREQEDALKFKEQFKLSIC